MEQCSRVLFSLRQPRHSPLSHELQIKWLRQAAKPALLKLYAAPLKLSASGKATETPYSRSAVSCIKGYYTMPYSMMKFIKGLVQGPEEGCLLLRVQVPNRHVFPHVLTVCWK